MKPQQNNSTKSNAALQVFPLSEGAFTIDSTKLFVPFNEQKDDLQQRPAGSLLVEIQPFVVITPRDIIVMDAGLGFKDKTGDLQFHGALKNLGIEPGHVTKVLMSHLHKDHAGGIAMNENKTQLSFPNATYFIQKRELDFAFERGVPSYIPGDLELLKTSPQVHFLHDDSGVIDAYISYQHTGAHSPHHQVFWIKWEDEIIFFGGDVAPQLQQMKMRYKTKYDYEPERAMQLRRAWWQQGAQENWTFLFYHDIKTPVYQQQAENTI